MKNLFAFLLVMLSVISSKAQFADTLDPDAESYCIAKNITDTNQVTQIHRFISGLKRMSIWSSLVYLDSYDPANKSFTSTTITPIVGTTTTAVGCSQNDSGFYFPDSDNSYLWIVNPLTATTTNHTVIASVDSDVTNASAAVVSGYQSGSARGPAFYLGGSPNIGTASRRAAQFYSDDGSTSPSGISTSPGLIGSQLQYGNKQMISWSMGATRVSIRAGIQDAAETTGSFGPAYNGSTNWYIGRGVLAGNPFKGTINSVGIWNSQLPDATVQAYMKLFRDTIGRRFVNRVNVAWDGDSISDGSGPDSPVGYRLLLYTNSSWGPVFTGKNISASGESAEQIYAGLEAGLLSVKREFATSDRNYYALMGGANNIAGSAGSASASVTFDYLSRCWSTARTNGFKVIAFTLFETAGMNTAAELRELSDLNGKIRQAYAKGYFDYLVDLQKLPQLQDNLNVDYFQSDNIHPSTGGHLVIANEIARVIPNP